MSLHALNINGNLSVYSKATLHETPISPTQLPYLFCQGPQRTQHADACYLTGSHEVFQRKLVELEFPIHTVHELLKLTDGEAAGTKTGVEMVGGLVK